METETEIETDGWMDGLRWMESHLRGPERQTNKKQTILGRPRA